MQNNKEIAKRMLETNGVNGELLEQLIAYAKRQNKIEDELTVTLENASMYRVTAQQEIENLEEEIRHLKLKEEELKSATTRLIEEDVMFLSSFINIDLSSEDGKEAIKRLQEVASRRLGLLDLTVCFIK